MRTTPRPRLCPQLPVAVIYVCCAVRARDGSRGSGFILKVKMEKGLIDAYEGASIAINGVCLTVLEWPVKDGVVSFGVAPETIKLTNLGDQKPGDKVNVERSQQAGGRNSGHYVQGHVDNTAKVVEKYMDGESLRVRMQAPPDLAPFILKKGYISIDGTSLTITEANSSTGVFAVMLVTHTQRCIVLPQREVGERVNIEVDVMTKAAMQAQPPQQQQAQPQIMCVLVVSVCSAARLAVNTGALENTISVSRFNGVLRSHTL